MGFNIGVHSKQETGKFNCYNFIDRIFFNFVNSGEMYGEESIIIQSGKYYGLDLTPLTKFVYTWDEPTEDYINENIQKTEILLELILSFKDRIVRDKTVCEKIEYIWTDKPYLLTDQEIENMKKEVGETATNDFITEMARQQKEIDENPNPWNWYFVEGKIIEDLDNLIKSIQCYKDNGIEEIFLTAG